MKQFFKSFFLLFAAMTVTSCGGDNDDPIVNPEIPEGGGETEISVVEKTINGVVAEGMETSVSFTANENWRAKSDVDWIVLSPTQGTASSSKVSISIKENTTTDERKGNVTVETINGNKTIAKVSVSQKGREVVNNPDENANAPAGMKKNAQALVNQIAVGWNLGNTCESGIWDGYNKDVDAEGETAWGNPKTTKAMITALKDAGFNAIRIPTRWYLHADEAMNIREAWLARVKEIVDYAVTQDMYVILNSHHDNWYDRLPVGYDEVAILDRFEKMWTQIATYFKDYDERLILAGTNEVIKLTAAGAEDWGSPTSNDIGMLNKLNQKFVDAVRATGGNNEWRCLMVQPWACSPSNALKSGYKLPTDKQENRLIQEFHCYDPWAYATNKDAYKGQTDGKHEYSQDDLKNVESLLLKLKQKFVEQGIPCVMAEFGSTQDNTYSKGNDAADKLRAEYLAFMVKTAKENGIPGFYWDNGSFNGVGDSKNSTCENFGLLDRKTCTFPDRAKIALQGIMDGL